MPTLRAFGIANWEVARCVVIAVTALAYAIGATNDDVACERRAGAISTIGIAGTDDSTRGVDCELRAGNSGRSRDEDSSVLHID